MPALEALLSRFEAANTQPLGASVDSVHSHANWADSLGGISFPLLADFHPKGSMAASYGLYLEDEGMTARATVVVDAGGVVRHASIAPKQGRDIGELAAICEQVDKDAAAELTPSTAPVGIEPGATLFAKNGCGFSRAALLARTNLHLQQQLQVRNVSEDPDALVELDKLTGKQQVPALHTGAGAMAESRDIIRELVTATTGLWH